MSDAPRVGIAYDIHRLAPGRALRLGGVEIPHERGLLGHSDADVVLHALTDAILGAAAEGDIGELFPDTDPANKDADSRRFVAEALRRAGERGLCVGNVDVVIHAQVPRLGPHKQRIRESVARILGVSAGAVGVKATTNEGLDAIGRGEAIACFAAVVLVSRRPD